MYIPEIGQVWVVANEIGQSRMGINIGSKLLIIGIRPSSPRVNFPEEIGAEVEYMIFGPNVESGDTDLMYTKYFIECCELVE